MIKEVSKKILAVLLVIIMMISVLPMSVFAEEAKVSQIFSDEVIFEIHEVDATGEVVATIVNGQLVWTKSFEEGKDYYIDISVPKSMGTKYLQLTTGNFPDGNTKGIKYQNMPGQDGGLYPKQLDAASTLSRIVSYEGNPAKEYGKYTYNIDDGKLIYQIAENQSAEEDARINFSLGFQLDPFLYNNLSSIQEVLCIKIGDYDETTNEVIPLDGYEQDVDLTSITQKNSSGSSSSGNMSAILDEKNEVVQYWRFGNTGNVKFIYETFEFDFYIPEGVELNDIGFGASFVKFSENLGTLTCSEEQFDDNGDRYFHVTMEKGMKTEGSMDIRFQTTVLSTDYKIGDVINISAKNQTATLSEGNKYQFANTSLNITVIDPDNDDSLIEAKDRTVYNDTIDTDELYKIQLSKCVVRKPSAVDTPYDKIFEAEYNVNNADAVITSIIIPMGLRTDPDITVTGLDDNNNEVSVTIENPSRYVIKTNANTDTTKGQASYDYAYLIAVEDIGLKSIKSVKAYLGKVKGLYNTNKPWDTVVYYEYSSASAYGYFTNDSAGIQVVSNYRYYNEVPAYRTKKNGNLSATSVFTSTDDKIMCMQSGELQHFYGDRAQQQIDYVKGTRKSYVSPNVRVSRTSPDTAPAITPGESITMSSYLFPYSAIASTTMTEDTEGNVILGKKSSTVSYLADPVFYLTLPGDFRYEDIAFALEERSIYYNSSYYLKNNYSDSMYYGTENWTRKYLTYTVENVTYLNKTGDGRNLYKITFPKDSVGIGLYTKEGKMRRLVYAVKIGTSKSSATQRYPITDLMQISGENPYAGAVYSTTTEANYTVIDKYGLNDGKDISGVIYGSYKAGEQLGFSLQKLSDVNAYNYCTVTKIDNKPVSQDWYSYVPNDANSIALLGAKSEGKYKLIIQNTDATHDTQKLQAVIPIPKKGVDMGTAFMENAMQYSMDFTWKEEDVPEGFTIKYINVDYINAEELIDGLNYTECDKDQANAILMEADSLEANRTVEFYYDFVISDDAQHGEINIFHNALRYTDYAHHLQTKVGSKIAVEVAKGKLNGTAFYDINRNGIYDEGEEPVSGINVRVVDGTGKFQYVTTDEDGFYEFNAVRETDVKVTFTVDSSSRYRMNVPCQKLTLAEDAKSATNEYDSLVEETLDVPLDKYFTVTYSANPPSGKTATGNIPKTQEYYRNEEAKVSPKPDNLAVAGYKFINWNTKADGSGTSYEPNETFIIAEDTVLYAQWEKLTLYLIFDYDGGSTATLNKDLIYQKRKAAYPYIIEEHYEEGLVKIPFEYGDTIRSAITRYFFGQTEKENSTFQFWFQMPYSNAPDEPYEIPKSGSTGWPSFMRTTKNGYNAHYDNSGKYQNPWYIENKNGSKTYVTGGNTLNYSENVTVHITWTPKEGYSIKYDTDGGNTIDDSTNLNWETNVSSVVNKVVPVKSGYNFSHWEFDGAVINKDAMYGDFAVEDTVTSITVKAVYTEKTYKVQYDSMGGTAVDSRIVLFDQANMNSLTAPTKPGYVFKGWSTSNTEEALITNDIKYSDLVNNDPDVTQTTLYAVWAQATGYTVLFDTNGGTAVSTLTNLAYDSNNLLANATTTRPGYEFVNWTYNDTVVTNDMTYGELAKDEALTTIELKANWSAVPYTVQYTNVVDPIDEITVTYDDSNLLPKIDPVKKGYKFIKWTYKGVAVSQDNTVKSLNPDSTTLVMVANWEQIKYTVEYDSNGGTYVDPLVDKNVDTSNLIPSNCTRSGYNLEGWYSEEGVKISPTTKIGDILTGDETTVKLIARWTPKTGFIVKYNLAGGKTAEGQTTIDDKSVAWTDSNLIPENDPVRDGYTFKGWTYGTKIVDSATTYNYLAVKEENSSITLVATWEKKEVVIEPVIMGATLFIEEKIGVNFYVDLGAQAVKDDSGNYTSTLDTTAAMPFNMKFVMKDSQGNVLCNETAYFNSAEVSYMNVKGTVKPLYRFTHWAYAYEMVDTIEATMYKSNTSVTDTKSYSVLTYTNRMMPSANQKLKDFLVGMLNYGANSQVYFNYNASDLATKNLSAADKDLSGVDVSKYAPEKTENISGIGNSTIALKFRDGGGFDLKFKITTVGDFYLNNLNSATLQSDVIQKIKKKNSSVVVDINNPYDLLPMITESGDHVTSYDMVIERIPVYNWGDDMTVTLKDASGKVYSCKYSLLSYAYCCDSGDGKLTNLLKSMVLYNEKSKPYFSTLA